MSLIASGIRRALVFGAIVVACSSDPVAPAPQAAPPPASSSPTCAADTKLCDGRCVSRALPETGCADSSCAPCKLAHASAACSAEGACKPASCENGFGDCDGQAGNGCETDVRSSDAHCGACGNACEPSKTCRASTCVDRNAAAVEAWLATQTEGWCAETYNQLLNLCGDVDFCFDSRVMRTYPTGLAVDVGFDWQGAPKRGNIASFGGDCNGQAIGIFIETGGLLSAGGFNAGVLQVKLTPGKHLVSYQVTTMGTALFLDGIRVAVGGAPTVPPRLLDSCGPGLILGGRLSYWWEAVQQQAWLQYAPFFVQLREGVADASLYTAERAMAAGQGTVFLFDKTGVSGSTWKSRVGDMLGIAKNSLDGTPQLDAGASGPLPAWKPLASCTLK